MLPASPSHGACCAPVQPARASIQASSSPIARSRSTVVHGFVIARLMQRERGVRSSRRSLTERAAAGGLRERVGGRRGYTSTGTVTDPAPAVLDARHRVDVTVRAGARGHRRRGARADRCRFASTIAAGRATAAAGSIFMRGKARASTRLTTWLIVEHPARHVVDPARARLDSTGSARQDCRADWPAGARRHTARQSLRPCCVPSGYSGASAGGAAAHASSERVGVEQVVVEAVDTRRARRALARGRADRRRAVRCPRRSGAARARA